jgi:hypothetical protein
MQATAVVPQSPITAGGSCRPRMRRTNGGKNRVNGYEYARYLFSNRSPDIQRIFKDACLGINCRNNNKFSVSIARRRDVEKLEVFVGPKR